MGKYSPMFIFYGDNKYLIFRNKIALTSNGFSVNFSKRIDFSDFRPKEYCLDGIVGGKIVAEFCSQEITRFMHIKILLADDHKIFSRTLANSLRHKAGIEIVGQVWNGRMVEEYLQNHETHLVIIDLRMPLFLGAESIKKLVQQFPDVRLLVLSMEEDPTIIRMVIKAGARGYVTKTDELEELEKAIDCVMAGELFLSKVAIAELTRHNLLEDLMEESVSGGLTPREMDVLGLLAQGFKGVELAEKLFISPHTLKIHRKNLLRKLQATSTEEMLKNAKRLGLIDNTQ